MAATIRIGMITPSSNTSLEPVTYGLLEGVDAVTVHFARVPVTRISLASADSSQFGIEPMVAAARLLADAGVHVVAWNGTSGSWLGLDEDRALCRALADAAGAPATTSTLALLAALRSFGISRLGLATPYTADVAARIVDRYAGEGFEVTGQAHLGITDNRAFGEVDADTLQDLAVRASKGAEAVAIVCTNLRAAPLVPALEAMLGIPVFDSVAVTLWQALQLGGAQIALPSRGQLLARVQAADLAHGETAELTARGSAPNSRGGQDG